MEMKEIHENKPITAFYDQPVAAVYDRRSGRRCFGLPKNTHPANSNRIAMRSAFLSAAFWLATGVGLAWANLDSGGGRAMVGNQLAHASLGSPFATSAVTAGVVDVIYPTTPQPDQGGSSPSEISAGGGMDSGAVQKSGGKKKKSEAKKSGGKKKKSEAKMSGGKKKKSEANKSSGKKKKSEAKKSKDSKGKKPKSKKTKKSKKK
jgi:hypothetical protein